MLVSCHLHFRSDFRCCTHKDAPDSCMKDDYYGYDGYHSDREDSDSLFGAIVNSPDTSCTWSLQQSTCPDHISAMCLGSGVLRW